MELYEHSKKVQKYLDEYIYKKLYLRDLTESTVDIMQEFRKFLSEVGDFEDTTVQSVIAEYEKIFEVSLPNLKKTTAEVTKRTYDGMLNQIPQKLNQQLANLNNLLSSAVDTGGLTRQEAVEEAQMWLDRMRSQGKLKYIHAYDKAGRKWRLDYLVKRDLRDAQKKSANTAAERINRQYDGNGVYKITTLSDSRDDHVNYQGKYFADVPGQYEVIRAGLITALPWSYARVGEVDGLFGINCRHVKIPVFAERWFNIGGNFNPLKTPNRKLVKIDRKYDN